MKVKDNRSDVFGLTETIKFKTFYFMKETTLRLMSHMI